MDFVSTLWFLKLRLYVKLRLFNVKFHFGHKILYLKSRLYCTVHNESLGPKNNRLHLYSVVFLSGIHCNSILCNRGKRRWYSNCKFQWNIVSFHNKVKSKFGDFAVHNCADVPPLSRFHPNPRVSLACPRTFTINLHSTVFGGEKERSGNFSGNRETIDCAELVSDTNDTTDTATGEQ